MFNLANCCFFEGRISRDPQFSQVQMGIGQNGQPNMVDKALFSIAVDRALSSQQRQKAAHTITASNTSTNKRPITQSVEGDPKSLLLRPITQQ